MYRKKVILLVIFALMLTGCTRLDNNIDNIVSATMTKEIGFVNTVSTGYELYVPIGVLQENDSEYNQKFKIRDIYVYLYVDTVSYYYKNNLNHKSSEDYNYYYKDINLNDKSGYIGIKKIDDDSYFTEIVYNYSKIEFYSNYYDMPFMISNSLMILNSIKFNDNLIRLDLDVASNDGREVKYELDKPEDSGSTFSQVLQEYVEPEKTDVVLPDSE